MFQPIDCLAAIAWSPNKPLDVTKVTIGAPGPGEVRIKVIKAEIPSFCKEKCLNGR